MNFQFINFELDTAICRITLNRPEVFNALHGGILKEIAHAVDLASKNEAVRAILLTGTGEKAFCSGADLKDGGAMTGKPLGEILNENYEPVIFGIRNCPKPVVCKLNGVAAGAGMSLALACDIIIADESTYMTELFVGIGLLPDAGSMFFLPRMVGIQKAFEIFSTGRKVYMEEAVSLGLVTKAVPASELDAVVNELLDYYASAPTFAIGEMKKILNKTYESSFEDVLKMEADGQTQCGLSNDFGEGVMGFLQKRTPKFKGN
ncbi:MAG: 2-(1,2-epoxy-1,2-dihydrophenyl)acetyl-CoA isomerase [Arcticibacterium sp.]|jgi:2-(1,2-epoxy-1,2-dihydrophenyl)acetyl-CoA isomerase